MARDRRARLARFFDRLLRFVVRIILFPFRASSGMYRRHFFKKFYRISSPETRTSGTIFVRRNGAATKPLIYISLAVLGTRWRPFLLGRRKMFQSDRYFFVHFIGIVSIHCSNNDDTRISRKQIND